MVSETTPKAPAPFETWLDYALDGERWHSVNFEVPTVDAHAVARAELASLRSRLSAAVAAMATVAELLDGCEIEGASPWRIEQVLAALERARAGGHLEGA